MDIDDALNFLGVPPAKPATKKVVPRPSRLKMLTIHGVTKSRRDWALETGVPWDVIRKRMARGATVAQAVNDPLTRRLSK
jgi:hypothetical protein